MARWWSRSVLDLRVDGDKAPLQDRRRPSARPVEERADVGHAEADLAEQADLLHAQQVLIGVGPVVARRARRPPQQPPRLVVEQRAAAQAAAPGERRHRHHRHDLRINLSMLDESRAQGLGTRG